MDAAKIARFWSQVQLGAVQPHCPELGPCLIHPGSRNRARVAWEIYEGPIPPGMHVLHRCDNGPGGCVRRSHLFLGTHAENMADKTSKGRQARGSCVSLPGEIHGRAKMSDDDARLVLESHGKIPNCVLAERYGVTRAAISHIWAGRNWRHLKR